jgi:DNA-binding MarR family transcriptional regulator
MSLSRKLHLYHRLQLAAHRIQKAADRTLLADTAVTTAQAAVLSVVMTPGTTTQREVARRLGLNESAVAGMVTRLLDMSLLEREPHPVDSRAWSLKLTAAGRGAVKRIERSFAAINARIDAELSAEELTQLADYLQRLSTVFEKQDE